MVGIKTFTLGLGIQFELTAAGDNQMIKLIHDANMTDSEIYARTQEFFDRIEMGFQRIGMKLKRAESWMSSELYIFGKDIYYRGNRMPLRSKRAGNTSRYSSTDRYSLSTAA